MTVRVIRPSSTLPLRLVFSTMYTMTDITARVLGYIRKHALLRPGDRVGVAVSGGADSVALLRILVELRSELGTVLSVVHFNHQLRGADSDADEAFVRALAAAHNLQFHSGSGDTRTFAQSNKLSLETAARELRYAYFRSLITGADRPLDKIATAHTLDDQAETVLMRILRGTGPTGLSGIYPAIDYRDSDHKSSSHPQAKSSSHPERSEGSMHFAHDAEDPMVPRVPHICPPLADVGSTNAAASPSIVRPLLEIRRSDIEHYLRDLHQPWCTDATNADLKHTRNRVRHELLPLLERDFNPALRDRLSELTEIARAEEDYWQEQVRSEVQRLTAAATWPETAGYPKSAQYDEQFSLHLDLLAQIPLAMQRRVVRHAAKSIGLTLDFGEVEEILSLAAERATKTVQLHDRWAVSITKLYAVRFPTDPEGVTGSPRSGRTLLFHRMIERHSSGGGYEYGLSTPGQIKIPELGTLLRTRLISLQSVGADRTKQRETPASDHNPSYTRSQLLNPQLLTSELLVRNWRPGDRFWPAHTSFPKKIKELLQQKHITGSARQTWPVVVNGDEIVWMRGFPVPEKYRVPDGAETALLIEEAPLMNA